MIKGGVTAFGRFNLAYYAAQKDPWPTQASPNAITNNRQNLPLSCKLTYFTDQWITRVFLGSVVGQIEHAKSCGNNYFVNYKVNLKKLVTI